MGAVKRSAIVLGMMILAAPVAGGEPAPPVSPGREYVPTTDPQHPKARYTDSLVSMNDRCPVSPRN
jgi:hypothetical protein